VDRRWQGTEVLVQFTSGLRLWVPAHRVLLTPPVEKRLDEIQARRMIEAFRLGIVPHQDVDEFTFGRESEIRNARQGLENLIRGEGGVLLVEGDYGTGKTHLLEHIHHEALRMGMVTSKIEFDPAEVAPNRPKRVYRELVHNLRWIASAGPDQPPEGYKSKGSSVEYGFRDLLRKAVDLPMDDHVFFSPVLAKLRQPLKAKRRSVNADLAQEVFWQMIEAESTKEYAVEYRMPYRIRGGYSIPALYDFSTAGDFYCYIISGLGHICRELGLHGLVLLIDEAETVTHLWDIIAFARGMNFIEGLIRTAQNDPELRKVDDKLIHNRVRTTPYIYRTPYIYMVIATTPEPCDYAYLKMTNYARNRLALAPLRDQALFEAFDKLVAVYRRAFAGFDFSEVEKKRMLQHAFRKKNEGIRYFVKFCVEALDLQRIYQHVDYRSA
jgi:hypothetical protein